MSRRIEIEITSLNGDVATWRAAGAKLPKGVLNSSLVPGGPVVGNVYRADVEQYMEGIEILSVMAPKTASPLDPRHERIELIPTAKTGPDVVVTYAPKGRGGRSARWWRRLVARAAPGRRESGPGRRDSGPGRRETGARRREGASPSADGTETRDASTRPERTKRPPRTAVDGEASTSSTGERSARGPRPERPTRGARPPRPERPAGPAQPPMTTTHRNALLATLVTRATARRRTAAARRHAVGARGGRRTEQERHGAGSSDDRPDHDRPHRRRTSRQDERSRCGRTGPRGPSAPDANCVCVTFAPS